MGFDCGFDIFPRLEATTANTQRYQRFLDEIVQKYGEVHNENARRPSGKVLSTPSDPDSYDKISVWFMVGECPHMPSNPARCDYFLRFSSKVSGHLTTPAEPYITDVHKIAEKHFGSNVHFWHELNETGDERQYGYYDWNEIYAAEKKLKELEQHGVKDERDMKGEGDVKEECEVK